MSTMTATFSTSVLATSSSFVDVSYSSLSSTPIPIFKRHGLTRPQEPTQAAREAAWIDFPVTRGPIRRSNRPRASPSASFSATGSQPSTSVEADVQTPVRVRFNPTAVNDACARRNAIYGMPASSAETDEWLVDCEGEDRVLGVGRAGVVRRDAMKAEVMKQNVNVTIKRKGVRAGAVSKTRRTSVRVWWA
jgi:hypothetical protein